LAAVVGSVPLPRGAVVSKVWDYIKAHNLQNPGKPPRDRGGRQAAQGVRQGQGDHVRDEQTPAQHLT
jgi:SWIB/MDM2 domain